MLSISELSSTRPATRARAVEPLRADEARPAGRAAEHEGEPRLAADRVSISSEAREAGAAAEAAGAASDAAARAGDGDAKREGGEKQDAAGGPGALSAEEKALVAELQARDAHVRAHEGAHQSAGGGMTGAASYTYQTGPDGRAYAVGGEVPIRIESGRTPEETIRNAAQARAAALAPPDPSAADLSVAAAAAQMEAQARMQLARRATAAYRATSEEAGLAAYPYAAAA